VSGADDQEIGRVFREEAGRCLAALIRMVGQIEVAEDAVQEAFVLASRSWPRDGLPVNPGGWITTTARNCAIDRLRRETRGSELLREVSVLQPGPGEPFPDEEAVQDDQLRLIFTCCHPALSAEAQVALTLRLLGGLTTQEVARAFLVSESTMAQRLVRAKQKIRLAQIPYRVPEADELPGRLSPVLSVVYLIYNAGADQTGAELRSEALRLARLLRALLPDEPEVESLLALLLLAQSRRPARRDADGSLVLLRDQDRRLWDRAMVEEGLAIVSRLERRQHQGPYQLQAAIGAVHAGAATVEDTAWTRIAALYDELVVLAPTPVVRLNRAVAVSEVDGAAAGLALLDGLDLDGYHPFHATRAHLLRRLGRHAEASEAYHTAASLAGTTAERDFLAGQARHAASHATGGCDCSVQELLEQKAAADQDHAHS
jgi:RNA polymerase sigma-70 factor (ECF subfamily)